MQLGLAHRAYVRQPLVMLNIAGDGTATNAIPHSIFIVPNCSTVAGVALGGP